MIVCALLARRLAMSVNALGSGFAAGDDGRLTERDGRASQVCFTLAAPHGDLLETVAVAEIQVQAARIAGSIAGRGAGHLVEGVAAVAAGTRAARRAVVDHNVTVTITLWSWPSDRRSGELGCSC